MRVMIAEDELLTRMDIKAILQDAGFEVVGEAKDGIEAVQVAGDCHPDVALMDIKMPHLDGIGAARMMTERNFVDCVVLLTAFSDEDSIKNALQAGVYGYLVKPLNTDALVSTIQIAYQKCQEHKALQGELSKSKQKLEDRIVIERAKGCLMKQYQMSEDEAYLKIRSLSQSKHCSMRFIAEAIMVQQESDHEQK